MSLPQKMDALVLKGVRDFVIDTVSVPQPDADEVICKVDTTYICGTDPHIINGDFPGFWPTAFPFVPACSFIRPKYIQRKSCSHTYRERRILYQYRTRRHRASS